VLDEFMNGACINKIPVLITKRMQGNITDVLEKWITFSTDTKSSLIS